MNHSNHLKLMLGAVAVFMMRGMNHGASRDEETQDTTPAAHRH